METVEFMKQKNRMCDYYVDGCTRDGFCEICPAHDIDCEITTDKPEQLVAIVEQWVKEHPEKPEQEQQKPERERQKPEQKRQNTEQDDIEGAIYREIISHKTRIENLEYDVSVIRHNLEGLDDQIHALREKVDHATTTEQSQTSKPKRTNKDVLLAAFPRMVMDGDVPVLCPRTMERDIHIQHCAVRSCDQCRHEYWLSEVEK